MKRGARIAILLSSALAACSSTDHEGTLATPASFHGMYSAKTQGPIGAIEFNDANTYVLWRGGSEPLDEIEADVTHGQFLVNEHETEVVLTDGETGRATKLPLRILHTVPNGTPADATPGGRALTPRTLAGSKGEAPSVLVTPLGPLFRVERAELDGQVIELVSAEDSCVRNLPIPGSTQDVYARAQSEIQRNHGSMTGDVNAGTFALSSPFGPVAGSYRVLANRTQLQVTITSHPFLFSCAFLFRQLGL